MEAHLDPLNMAMAWHGRFMVIAWVVLFPIGVLVARFAKVMPGQDWPRVLDNKTWWYAHLVCQYAGIVAVAVAFVLILTAPPDPLRNSEWHTRLGWLVVVLCVAQFASGLLRGSRGGPDSATGDHKTPGDHYNMTRRRRIFELFHKSNGYLALLLSMVSVVTGLAAASAPFWMLPLIVLWWSLCVAVFVLCQRRGLAMNSYEAIWGPGRAGVAQANSPVARHASEIDCSLRRKP